ncbi:MAG: hypothetical protein KDC48_11455 [Planctomycetes bacterium]|nr:hypothetical protein [Planctomycetota bacterium]
MLDGKTGAVVPKGDAEALAGALSIYLSNPAIGVAHGAAGREHCLRHFTVDRLGPDIEAVVRRLVG